MLCDHDVPGSISDHLFTGFMVVKVALVQVIFEYLDFPCQFSLRQMLVCLSHLSQGAGAVPRLLVSPRPNNKIICGKNFSSKGQTNYGCIENLPKIFTSSSKIFLAL
jgi:hypothetical protein